MIWPKIEELMGRLAQASQSFDCASVIALLKEAGTGYSPTGKTSDLVWCRGEDRRPNAETSNKVIRLN